MTELTLMDTHERIERLVLKLGGAAHIAKTIGATNGSVRMWRSYGRIPWRWRASVAEMAQERGMKLSAAEKVLLALKPDW